MDKIENLKIIISGPSGVGKTTVINSLLEDDKYKLSISYTTRPQRERERNGHEYFFISFKEFEELRDQKFFFETEFILNNWYGTPNYNSSNHIMIFNLDCNGAINMQNKFKNTISIFLIPPSIESIKERLSGRTENCIKRFKSFADETQKASFFDYCVINEDLSTTINEIQKIIDININSQKGFNLLETFKS